MKISFGRLLAFRIIPFLLILFWIIFSLFFASKYSFSVIYSAYDKSNFISLKTDELLARQKVSAQFKAAENNLGIISVRFKTYSRINDDNVIFRLKESGQKDWFYQYSYKVDQFQDNDYFTFGFPIITSSEGKKYLFEIESVRGQKGDAVSVVSLSPVFIAQYQFTKQSLFENKTAILPFLIKKFVYSFTDINFLVSSLVYLLPFVFYIFWIYIAKPLVKIELRPSLAITVKNWRINLGDYDRKKYILFYIYVVMLLILIFFMNVTNNYVYLILIVLWVLLILIYRLESSITFLLAFFLLLLCPVLLIFNQVLIAENAAIWVYFFLAIGTIEAMLEMKNNLQNMISYSVFLRENFTINSKGKTIK